VLSAEPSGAVRAWIDDGEVSLADDRARLFGADHPFLDEVVDDLTALCRHADAGDFVLCGWRHGMEPITFAMENGAHAGPCPAETEAFALLPDDAIPSVPTKPYLRPLDLRRCALHHLGRDLELPWRVEGRAARPDTLRVMTYNVHSCIGMDGKLSPGRVARVIARHRPDIVALQELDVGRRRTGGVDQAHQIARLLQMEFHFHPAIHLQEERYGDAILTHLPMRLVRAGRLPRPAARPWLEPRGALWAAVDTGGGLELQVVNTHLGLSQGERWEQVETLLGDEWLGHPDCRPPVILCGDLNARPGSRVCRRIVAHLDDAQRKIEGHRAGPTFASRYPTVRIDHIFVSAEIEVVSVEVLRTSMTRVASDHLPVLVEIRIGRD
jgi:endonuclease/exonuclease/phosphatase family metal-dependent hydrolase